MGWGRLQLLSRLLLLLAGVAGISCVHSQAAVNVSNSEQLLLALQSLAEVIVLLNDVAMGAEFEQFAGAPLQILRNITVTGAAGKRSGLDAMPVFDLENKVGVVELCRTCTFMFLWVSIANENRAGTGGSITVFRGSQTGTRRGSSTARVDVLGGVGLRPACPPTASALALLNNTQRSLQFDDPLGGGQLVGMADVTYRGRPYQDMLTVIDLSTDVVPQQFTNSTFAGGYAIRRRNVSRLCQHIVSAECLQRRLPEDCIAELLAGSSTEPGPRSVVVPIAVPVAVGGALIIVAVALLLWWQRRRRRALTRRQLRTTAKLTALGDPLGTDCAALTDQDTQSTQDWASVVSQQLPPRNSLQQPAVSAGGCWQLLWSSSAPAAGRELQHDIELGVLLGAGSFARVYRGRWAATDVAVKVIHHDLDSAQGVANEVQLMLNLNHPNIVRAYHCITKQMLPEQSAAATAATDPAVQQGTGSAQQAAVGFSSTTAPGSATGSIERPVSTGPHTARVPRFFSTRSLLQRQEEEEEHQLQPAADVVSLPDQGGTATYVPYVGIPMARRSSNTAEHGLDRLSQLGTYLKEGSASTAGAATSTTALLPATPSAAGEARVHPSTTVPTTTGSTQYGLLSSGGLSVWAQDLRSEPPAPPVCERKQPRQQPREQLSTLRSASSGSAGSLLSSAHTSSIHSLQQQQQLVPLALPVSDASGRGTASSLAAGSSTCSSWHVIGTASLGGGQPGSSTSGVGSASAQEGRGAGGTRDSSSDSARAAGRAPTKRASGVMCETWLVMELCDRGTLSRQVADWEPEHNEEHMLRLLHLLQDVARALKLLQSQHIVHADLNAHNVLVASSSVTRYGLVAKVADLGLSRVLKLHATHQTTGTVGMMTHQPPELLQDGRMSPALDIYSFGIMMFEVFTRQAAYSSLRVGQIYHQVVVLGQRPAVPADMPEDYELIVKRCWASDPADRPSVDMLLECLEIMIEDRHGQLNNTAQCTRTGSDPWVTTWHGARSSWAACHRFKALICSNGYPTCLVMAWVCMLLAPLTGV